MSAEFITRSLVMLEKAIKEQEVTVARGTLEQFSKEQGVLFGLEQAHHIIYRIATDNTGEDE